MASLAGELADAGLDPLRVNVQLRTLHPLVAAQLFIWRRKDITIGAFGTDAVVVEQASSSVGGGVVEQVSLAHGSFQSAAFMASPLRLLYEGDASVRRRIGAQAGTPDFPILRDLEACGATDYLALPLVFSAGRRGAVSFATRRQGGLGDAEVEALVALAPAFSACFDAHLANHVARTLLDTYVGRLTGERVLAGRIRSGDVERLEAAIWFSDLRGFTTISAAVPPDQLVAWLNAYFEAVCGPIAANGGEILKFIGDAVLAVFPVGGDPAAACRAARAAAEAAHVGLDALNARRAADGLPALRHGIALHVGEVQYGNIGAEARLDFTVIGSAVNLASRLEGLCARLARPTVASAAFAEHGGAGLVSLGRFELKGIDAPQEVFGAPSSEEQRAT